MQIAPRPEQSFKDLFDALAAQLERVLRGKRRAVHLSLVCLFSEGHLLIEDVPGVGKTSLAKAIARSIGGSWRRVQFTPDLLPSDVTGVSVWDRTRGDFEFRPGGVFANVVLADEINRASPKTQSALLEAMQERHVTLEGQTLPLPSPFIVIATQNPIEYEGTFPLPEAQLDRFLVKLSVGYPTAEEEDEILRRRADRRDDQVVLRPVATAATFLAMRAAVEEVRVDPGVRRYMVELAAATRRHAHVVVGTSPRGSLALLTTARAWAALDGRAYVLPDDVKRLASPALGHRIVLDPGLWNVQRSEQTILEEVVGTVPVPVLPVRA